MPFPASYYFVFAKYQKSECWTIYRWVFTHLGTQASAQLARKWHILLGKEGSVFFFLYLCHFLGELNL